MKKAIIAIDGSKSAMQAVEYTAQQFAAVPDLEIALIHVLPNLPAVFWDEGHILNENEERDRKRVIDKWSADQKARMEPVFRKAAEILIGSGMSRERIRTKSISDSLDIAGSLVEEAVTGRYQTLILGRCNHSLKHVLGSVPSKIISQANGFAVVVVD